MSHLRRVDSDLSGTVRNVEVTVSHMFRTRLEGCFSVLNRKHTDGRDKVTALDDVLMVVKTMGEDLHTLGMNERIAKQLRLVIVHRSTYIRAAAIRVIRHCCEDQSFPAHCWRLLCHVLLTRVACMDKKFDREKQQLILLMKQLVRQERTAQETPVLMLQAMTAMANNTNETHRIGAVEVLRDFAVQCPRLVAAANGIKCLVSAIIDPAFAEIADTLTQTLVYLLEAQPQRGYLRPHFDLQHLFSPITEYSPDVPKSASSKSSSSAAKSDNSIPIEKRWDASCKAIRLMMKSWPGLIAVSNSDKSACGIVSIVKALKIPGSKSAQLRELLFDTIIHILRGCTPGNLYDLIPPLSTDEKVDENISHLNVLKKSGSLTMPLTSRQSRANFAGTHGDNVLLVFLATTISSFIHHGLVDCLLELSKCTSQPQMSLRASQILQVVLIFADMLLNAKQCLKIHDGFDSLIAAEHETERMRRTMAQRNKTLSLLTNFEHHARHVNKSKPIRMDSVKATVDTSMDDQNFNLLMRESQVLVNSHKDWQKWNWDTIETLIQGPLRIPSRQQEALKTRLCKRIISFFKPLKRQFSEMPYNENSMRIARLGSQFIENLIVTEVGCKFLRTSGFLEELLQALNAELSANADQSSNRIFSEEHVTYTMSREYFAFIGTFSAFAQGVEMLEKSKIFNALDRLATSRDDICQLIIKNLDYSNSDPRVSGPARTILRTAMLSGSRKIRYFSTLRMRKLFRDCSKDFHNWGIELLTSQLNDEWSEVTKNAVKILFEACTAQTENLDVLIAQKPSIQSLERQSEGRRLLLKILSRPMGLAFLQEDPNWIREIMAEWREERNVRYVEKFETVLRRVMGGSGDRRSIVSGSILGEDGACLPPHLYGELCKTAEGCAIVAESGDVDLFIRQATEQKSDMLTRRQALWALGHVGSSDCGYDTFFANNDVLQSISDMAQDADSFSLRGTCMYVLSVLARSSKVRNELSKLGWSFNSNLEYDMMIAVPKDLTRFFTVPEYEFEGMVVDPPDPYVRHRDLLSKDDENEQHNTGNGDDSNRDDIQQKILQKVAQLVNPVPSIQSGVIKELKRLKQQYSDEFTSGALLFRALLLLSGFRFSLRTRRLILDDLFSAAQFNEDDFEQIDAMHRHPEAEQENQNDKSAPTVQSVADSVSSSGSSDSGSDDDDSFV